MHDTSHVYAIVYIERMLFLLIKNKLLDDSNCLRDYSQVVSTVGSTVFLTTLPIYDMLIRPYQACRIVVIVIMPSPTVAVCLYKEKRSNKSNILSCMFLFLKTFWAVFRLSSKYIHTHTYILFNFLTCSLVYYT
jgi:hypothetical protein